MRARPIMDDFSNVSTAGKAQLVKTTQDLVGAIDSSGLCMFANAIFPPEYLTAMIDAACNGDWTLERLHETGERIWNMERQFNNAAGFSMIDDVLPQRTSSEPAKGGAGNGEVADISTMLVEYYEVRGWDDKGVPLAETIQRLNL